MIFANDVCCMCYIGDKKSRKSMLYVYVEEVGETRSAWWVLRNRSAYSMLHLPVIILLPERQTLIIMFALIERVQADALS
jgi:hypothetical protein